MLWVRARLSRRRDSSGRARPRRAGPRGPEGRREAEVPDRGWPLTPRPARTPSAGATTSGCPFGAQAPVNSRETAGNRKTTLRPWNVIICSEIAASTGTTCTACHAEGRGFESLQPLRKAPLSRGSLVSVPSVSSCRPQISCRVGNASHWHVTRRRPAGRSPPTSSAFRAKRHCRRAVGERSIHGEAALSAAGSVMPRVSQPRDCDSAASHSSTRSTRQASAVHLASARPRPARAGRSGRGCRRRACRGGGRRGP